MRKALSKSLFLSAAVLSAGNSLAQGTWPGCNPVAAGEIKVTQVVTRGTDALEEPMKLAFESVAAPGEDAKDKVHVWFTERKGRLRKYDALQGKTLTVATFSLTIGPNASDGLLGIALDPGFKSNHHLYLYYTAGSGATATWRVSRFTLDPTHATLDKGTEKVLLDIPITIGSQHTGGALAFDAYGDLWISTGDNHLPGGANYYIHTSANTNDLRGKILRIKPKGDGTYDIPSGNLFPEGTEKTRPEIYVMGGRNPYTIALDPVRRWLAWGEVGPDNTDMDLNPMNESGSADLTEEYNLTTVPGNFGYPFFAGNKTLKSGINPGSPALPVPVNWNNAQPGLMTLPAAIPAIKSYRKSCAVTGPIYRYDGDLNSSIKFPPHFHRKWFTTDFNALEGNPINLFTLNAAGTAITGEETVLGNVTLYQPLDMQFGPDGALYVSNYSGYRTVSATTSIIRIEYTGACRPTEPKQENVGLHGPKSGGGSGLRLDIRPGKDLVVAVSTRGRFTLEVRDLLGRPVAFRRGLGAEPVRLQEVSHAGVYLVTVEAPEGRAVHRIFRD